MPTSRSSSSKALTPVSSKESESGTSLSRLIASETD